MPEKNNVTLNCPDCNSEIIVNMKQLLLGVEFQCFNCMTVIGLSSDSISKINDALKKSPGNNTK